ncbi:hypothetical protein D3C85_1219870 [compost metagenome]
MGVGDPAEGLQCFAAGRTAQADFLAVAAMQLEPALRTVQDRLRQPVAADPLPAVVLQADKALADRIGDVEHHVLEVVQALHQAKQGAGSFLLAGAGVVRRDDVPVQAEHGAAPLAHLGHDVAVLLLHVFEQLVLANDVALFGSIQELGQLGRGQSAGRVAANLMVQAGEMGGLGFADLGQSDRLAVRAEDAGSGHHAEGSGSSMS